MKPIRSPVRRRGTSITEMVITLAIGGAILATALHTLHTLMNVQNTAARTFAEATTTWRIGDLFRRDVHAAASAELSTPDEASNIRSLRLTLPAGREAEWTWENNRLTRRTTRDGQPEQTEPFRIPQGSQITFAADGEFLILTWTRPQGTSLRSRQAKETTVQRLVRIEAHRGRDARFAEALPE